MYDFQQQDRKAAEEQRKAMEEAILQQRLNQLRWLMSHPEGRAIWCWLKELTRYNISNSTGNSREYNYNGRRDVMVDMEAYADLLGLDGLRLRHAAEMEFAIYMQELKARVTAEPSEMKGVEVKPL